MPTHADADLIIKLYELRREPEMRKARKFVMETFWPQSFAEVQAIVAAFGSQENAWLRQVLGYWEMVASFVNRGILDADLLLDSTGELWFVYAKFLPMLEDARKALHPEFMVGTQKAAEATQRGRDRVAYMQKAFAARAERMKEQQSQTSATSAS
jgi:hypothetical protein